jgi:PleD family two-component response regulator
MALIVTSQEWVSLSVMTLFSPKGYAVLRAFTGSQALDRARGSEIDLLVIDRDLRDMTGVALTERLRADGLIADGTAVLMIAPSTWPRDEKLAALRAGAWEACSLPFDGEEVFLKFDTYVRAKLASDVTREQGLLDMETGLYNAQGLLRRISELGAVAERHRRSLACLIMSPGPAAATAGVVADWSPTAAASTLAEALRATGRASDTIGRLNDTEFVILAPDTDAAGAIGMAERLQGAVRSLTGNSDQAWQVRFGCYGVPNFRDASIAPSEMLVRAAEALRSADANSQLIRMFDSPTDQIPN